MSAHIGDTGSILVRSDRNSDPGWFADQGRAESIRTSVWVDSVSHAWTGRVLPRHVANEAGRPSFVRRLAQAAILIGWLLNPDSFARQGTGGSGLLVCPEARLTPGNLTSYDEGGNSVALDGDWLAVGNRNSPKGVGMFQRSGGAWIADSLLIPPVLPCIGFGSAMSLQADTLVVGAYADSTVAPYAGSCYVYLNTPGGWVLQATLHASDASANDHFGASVSVDGDTLLVSAPLDDDMGTESGSVYVFMRASAVWTEQTKLNAADGQPGDSFGAVDLEGDTAVVGVPGDDDQGNESGSAYVFRRVGQTWTQQAKLLAPITGAIPNANFGSCVGISAGRVLVGAPWTWSGTVAYYFESLGANWVLQGTLVPGTIASHGMALDFKGDRAVIGARQWLVPGTTDYVGRAFVYERTGLNWNLIGAAGRDPGLASAGYATSVSVSGDRFVVGTPYEPLPQYPNVGPGIVTVYTFVPEPVTYCTAKLNSMSCSPAMDMRGIPSGSAISGFQVLCTEVMNNEAGLLLYGTNGRANLPFSGGTLCMTAPLRRTVGLNSSGTPAPAVDCSGVFSLDLSGFAAGLLGGTPSPALRIAGTTVQCQWWGRDPGFPPPFNTTLSNALEFVVCP